VCACVAAYGRGWRLRRFTSRTVARSENRCTVRSAVRPAVEVAVRRMMFPTANEGSTNRPTGNRVHAVRRKNITVTVIHWNRRFNVGPSAPKPASCHGMVKPVFSRVPILPRNVCSFDRASRPGHVGGGASAWCVCSGREYSTAVRLFEVNHAMRALRAKLFSFAAAKCRVLAVR